MSQVKRAAEAADRFQLVLSSTLRSSAHTPANRHRAQQLAWRWIGQKWPRLVNGSIGQETGRFERSCTGARLTVLSAVERGSWSAEVMELARDSREWRTRVAVVDGGSDDILTIQTACTPSSTGPAKLAPPKLLAAWAQGLEIHDASEPLSGEPWWVGDEAATERFLAHLLAQERVLPVIALSNKGTSRYFGIDPQALATTMQGMAHVACVTPEARVALSRRLGSRLAPVQGAARIYGPGLRSDDSQDRHPLVRQAEPGPAERDPAKASFRQAVIRSACAASARAAAGAAM